MCAADLGMRGRITNAAGYGQTGRGGRLTSGARGWDGAAMPVPRRLVVAALALAGALAVPSVASAALRADSVTIGSAPAHVRVVVHFSGGPPLTGLERQTDAIDPAPLDGRAVVRINATGITTGAAQVTGSGVTAKVGQRPGNLIVVMTGQPRQAEVRAVLGLHPAQRPRDRPAAGSPPRPRRGC